LRCKQDAKVPGFKSCKPDALTCKKQQKLMAASTPDASKKFSVEEREEEVCLDHSQSIAALASGDAGSIQNDALLCEQVFCSSASEAMAPLSLSFSICLLICCCFMHTLSCWRQSLLVALLQVLPSVGTVPADQIQAGTVVAWTLCSAHRRH